MLAAILSMNSPDRFRPLAHFPGRVGFTWLWVGVQARPEFPERARDFAPPAISQAERGGTPGATAAPCVVIGRVMVSLWMPQAPNERLGRSRLLVGQRDAEYQGSPTLICP